ncbi:MAG: putative alanine rich lipoprotein LppW [Pseudonocardia sp.]|nr:putative alanine rich lipoprotein LppW [Pseudonocardia sp.]
MALATIGSSALIVRHDHHVAPDTVGTVDSHPALTVQTGPVATIASAVAAVDAMSAAAAGTLDIGVAVLDRTTGQLNLGSEGSTPFYSASVVKLFTVVDILHRTETGRATLTPAQLTDIQRVLTVSDDNAMNVLWEQFGGPTTVTELVGLAHLQDTRPPANPGEWGETKMSARDVVAVYQYLLTSLNQTNQQTVLTALASAQPTGADGFDQAFGLLRNPRAAGVAAKQGWMVDGASEYLHSTGVLGTGNRYVIAVLTKRPASDGYPAGRADVSGAVGRLTGSLGLSS